MANKNRVSAKQQIGAYFQKENRIILINFTSRVILSCLFVTYRYSVHSENC